MFLLTTLLLALLSMQVSASPPSLHKRSADFNITSFFMGVFVDLEQQVVTFNATLPEGDGPFSCSAWNATKLAFVDIAPGTKCQGSPEISWLLHWENGTAKFEISWQFTSHGSGLNGTYYIPKAQIATISSGAQVYVGPDSFVTSQGDDAVVGE